jgi:hypothetical protein
LKGLKTLEYPLKGPENEIGLYVQIVQIQFREDRIENVYNDIHKSEITDGFHLLIHAPFEVPSLQDSTHVQTLTNQTLEIRIIPELISLDDSLFRISPEE